MSKTFIPIVLRQLVIDRAQDCCEYCLIPQVYSLSIFEIDHIIAEKHDGMTTFDNLALSCAICNQHKGSDIASVDSATGLIVPLYHPRQQIWTEHFKIVDAQIIPLTAIARATVRLLRFNTPERVTERALLF